MYKTINSGIIMGNKSGDIKKYICFECRQLVDWESVTWRYQDIMVCKSCVKKRESKNKFFKLF